MEKFYIFLVLCSCSFISLVGTADIIVGGSVEELSAPKLISYPSPVTYFSNSVGLTLTCRATGPLPLLITWLSVDTVSGASEELPKIPGIREQLDNGSLHFSAFRADEYISSVHNVQYRCSVRNSVGTYLSPVFRVNAVMDENFQVSIKSTSGQQQQQQEWLEGNPALLECHVNNPPFYNQFTRIIAWKEIDQFGHEREIQITSGGDVNNNLSKYIISNSQERLLILQAPSQRLFVCVVQNTLNKQVKASAPFLFKTKTTSPPMPPVSVIKGQFIIGKVADLFCIVVGSPVPMWRWEKMEENGKWLPVNSGVQGPLLRLISNQNSERINGTYRCEASNALGTSTFEYSVEVLEKPVVSMEPKRIVAYPGQTAEYSCTWSGDFIWYKNGKPLLTSNRVKVSAHQLKILNVRLEDQGVYQCFGENSSEGSGELIFPPSAPELVHTFISQSVQPGPSISLKCSAVGNPIPAISWFIDDLMVSSSSSTSSSSEVERKYLWMGQQQRSRFHLSGAAALRETGISHESSLYHGGREVVSYLNISAVHVEDSGMYKCTASNLVRAVSHSARLNVYGGIFVREMEGSSLTYAHGDTVYIPCHYGGYPVDKIIWQKDSRNLISSENPGKISGTGRFSMFPNGTLRISEISADSVADKGRYTCVVSNRKGEIASGSLNINVMHPPTISSLKSEDTLNEGQRTSLVCNVISGDLPINISWLKDSLPIPTYLNVTENRVRFLSVLAFDELHETHSGEYTCIAENPARIVKQSAALLVRVSPKWTRPPQNTKAVLGSEHTLECRAKGVPSPTISWFRESNGIKVPLRANHKFHLLSNGTLLKIREIQESDGSLYICQAENGVGSAITQSAKLDVIIPARISGSETSLVIAEGASATLACQIHGDRPLQVMWKKDSVLLDDQQTDSRGLFLFQKVVQVNSTVLSAELKIDSSSLADSGIYECVASNQYGRDEKRIKLQVKARPLAPEDFMVEEIGSRFIRLKWSSSFSSSSSLSSSSSTDPITHFLVQWKKQDGPSSTSLSSWHQGNNLTVQAYLNQALVENLVPVTNYGIRIFAHNKIGQSLPTQPLVVLTLAEPPSGPPLNVSAVPIGPKSVVVRWKPPDYTRQHGTIQGYHVTAVLQQQQQLVSLFPKGSNKSLSVDVKLAEETQLEGLRPNAQYRVSVSAYNSAGLGPESPFLFIQTPEGAPDSPPVNVQCEPLSPKSVQVHWDSPPEYLQNGNILGYKVIYISVDGERLGEKPEVKKTSNKETTLHGLKSFTNYSVKVLAYTVGGESEPSRVVQCSTEEDIPGEPADIKVICSGGNSVVVSWLPPNSPNGLITKYTVFWKTIEDHDREIGPAKEKQFVPTAMSGQFSKEIRGLKENAQYKFWVSAMTTAGHGKPSKTESVHLTPNAVPRIASFPVIRSAAVGEAVQLPCLVFAAGGSTPRITWFKDHTTMETRGTWKNGTLAISRVKDYDEGLYTCRAENEHGSDEIEHRIIISRPPGTVPFFLGYVTYSSIQVHWDSPAKVHPSLIGYLLEWRISQETGDHQWSAVKLGEHLQSYVLEDLRCGTQYQIRIAGVNKVGRGVYSEYLISRTNGRHPEEKPRLTEILDGNGTMVRIDLTRWSDGGCPIRNFHVEYRKTNDSSWIPVVQRTDNSSRVFTLRTDIKSRYEIQVKVENDAGLVTKRFLVESHPDFFKNYAKVLERVEIGERETGSGNNVIPFYTDPHVLVPIISAFICTAAAAVCLLMVIIRRRNLRKQQQQSPSEWKFSGGGAVVAQGTRHSQQSWLSGSGGTGGDKCSSDLNDSGVGTAETTSIYATLNSTKPIPMTIRDSTVRLHSFGTYDNYDANPLTNHHPQHNMMPTTGQYMKKAKRKSSASSPLSPVEVCMQQVSCQMDFPGPIEPPHEFRSSTSSHLLHHHHSGSDSEEPPVSLFTQNRRGRQTPAAGGYIEDDGNIDELYHDYSYPYHEFPQSSSSSEMLQQQTNTLKKSASRKLQSGGGAGNKVGGSKRNSRSDEYFQ